MARSRGKRSREQSWLTLPDWSAEFAAAAIDRYDAFQKRLERSKRHDRIQRSWRSFYARDQNGNCDTTQLGETGRKGEVLLLQPNRYARLIRDHVTLVQQSPTKPEPMAANSDPKSQDQVKLARGICEHYKREHDLEGKKAERSFVAELCGDSYLHVPWDPEAGRERLAGPAGVEEQALDTESTGDDEPPRPKQKIIHEGDYRFSVRSPYEIAYDRTSPDPKRPRWWIVKEPVDRWELLDFAREEVGGDGDAFKKLEHAILNAGSWTEYMTELDYDDGEDDEFDDSIPIYYVYAESSRIKPGGRRALIIDSKNVLIDGPLGEPRAPVFRLSQGEVLFRNEATTANHDGLPLCDALGARISTILSNSANHGLARVLTPRKANLVQEEIDTGAASVNYDHVDDAGMPIPEPKIWNPPPNSPELYQAYSLFASELDLVMAGSPVTRGDPNATKGDSGSKVAALFAAAQNVGSSFVADVLRSEQELYTYLIQSLQLHATLPRVITIVGEHNTFAAREYTAADISEIPSVTVGQADPMRDTLAGKLTLVEAIEGKSPEQQKQIVAVLSTGRLESITDPTEKPRMLLERENEALRKVNEPPPPVIPSDPHREHWVSHMAELCDPEVRRNPMITSRVLEHARWHEEALTVGSPRYAGDAALLMTGQQPIPIGALSAQAAQGQPPQDPMAAPPPAGATSEPQPPQNAGPRGPAPNGGPGGPGGPGRPEAAGPGGMPAQPRMPNNPATGQPMPVQARRPQGAMGRAAGP